jgi:23S rRNA (uracil1939-C5)-methyltransferase
VVTKRKRGYAEARTLAVLEPSPDRVAPAAPGHPGTAWQVLPYDKQLAIKAEQVEDALRRIGKLDGFEMEPIVPAVEQWRYRNKLEYSFGAETAADAPRLGFHARGRWDEVVDVDDCHLASEANNSARNAVRDWAAAEGIPAYDPDSGAGALRNLVVREGRRTGQVQTRLVTAEAEFPRPPVDLHTTVRGPSGGTDGPTGVLGEEFLRERLGDLELRVSPFAFLQTNTETAERLYAAAREFAALGSGERLFDIYCGIGTIGLSMAADAGEVWGIETVADAIVDAKHNAQLNGIGNAHFRTADARLGIRPLVEEVGRPDVVVLDPPRAGLSAKIVRRVLECEAKRIVYVSCNPTTMAPNVRQMVDAGYKLARVRPVDMFPQTPHIEAVALLERTGTA